MCPWPVKTCKYSSPVRTTHNPRVMITHEYCEPTSLTRVGRWSWPAHAMYESSLQLKLDHCASRLTQCQAQGWRVLWMQLSIGPTAADLTLIRDFMQGRQHIGHLRTGNKEGAQATVGTAQIEDRLIEVPSYEQVFPVRGNELNCTSSQPVIRPPCMRSNDILCR